MYVYVLESLIDRKSYVGMTEDVERRLLEHNQGQHKYTKRHLPWKVVYTEEIRDRTDARRREKYLKSASGRRFLKKEVFK